MVETGAVPAMRSIRLAMGWAVGLLTVLLVTSCGADGSAGLPSPTRSPTVSVPGPTRSPTRSPSRIATGSPGASTAATPAESPTAEPPAPSESPAQSSPPPSPSLSERPSSDPPTQTTATRPASPSASRTPAASATPSASPTPTPSQVPSLTPTPSPTPSATPSGEADGETGADAATDEDVPSWVWWALAGLGVLAVALTVVLVGRSRRRRDWDADLTAVQGEAAWLAGELLPHLQQSASPEAVAGGWRVAVDRVVAAEDRLTALESTAPEVTRRDRARALRDAVREAHQGVDVALASGAPAAMPGDLASIAQRLSQALDRTRPPP